MYFSSGDAKRQPALAGDGELDGAVEAGESPLALNWQAARQPEEMTDQEEDRLLTRAAQ